MTIKFSRWLAIVGGFVLPLAETIRRWSTWRESPANLFDDYVIGAFLLYGAWRVGKDPRNGQRYLAAAWAFACGMGYFSFFRQLERVQLHEADPAPISSESVLIIKGVMWGLAIVALALTLRRLPEASSKS
ncbi:MAG TPA: hypothetical protein VEM96_17245 [Pyrinomonadaceae bacterium]|nr:hypothetical protein [Pyrinomonadaceae bacterium]